jgi:hypothetical protein
MLPAIRQQARIAFRSLPPERREELVAAVVANCLAGFVRLVERGKQDAAYPTALARYGIAQVRGGRRLGNRLRIGDALSPHAQYKKQFFVERLDQFKEEENCWQEIVVEDKKSTPAQIAICRIDFVAWLGTMSALRRKIAQCLATGESTLDTARRFALSPGRISQLRREFRASWQAFHGEPVSACGAAA